jgi:RNA polymerase primary sigma factor
LLKAVIRFDHRLPYRFCTYATWWIRHSITRAIQDKSHTVRPPVHTQDLYRKIRDTQAALYSILGREPTEDELCRKLQVKARKVRDTGVLGFREAELSIQHPITEDFTLEDILPDHHPDSEQALILEVHKELLYAAIAELPLIEQDIVKSRFGVNAHNSETLAEIGIRYDLSRERIRQIEAKALTKLRRRLARVLIEESGDEDGKPTD